MPKILNYTAFCENLDEVTSLKTFGKRTFHSEGLFSEQIFGPLKNYTCQCGIYHGVSKAGGHCNECGVDIVNSDERRKRFAKITIPIKIVNPLFYDLVVDLAGKNFKKALDDLMKNDKSFFYTTDEEFVVTVSEDSIPENAVKYERSEAIYQMISMIANDMVEDEVEGWDLVLENLDSLLIDQIIVLPPDLRPTSRKSGGGKDLMDKINRYYIQILNKKESMAGTIVDIHRDKTLYYTYFKQLQKDVNELYVRILEKMAKKEGLIRGNILGKRIDFSGRAVITPDPTLSLDECKLPYLMILEIFKLPIAKRILELGKFKLLNEAIDFVDECIDRNSLILYNVCKSIIHGEYCILNRQPSLHKLSMIGFKIKITKDHVIKIHPLACPPFNADFDGDQMAVYIPISKETKEEVAARILITNNLYSPANEDLSTTPSQDIILGIYYLTSPQFSNPESKIEFKNEMITEGEAEFNRQLPDDYPVITGTISKKTLMNILNDVKENYPPEQVVQVLDNIKKIGFKYATLFGSTMSLDDCEFEESKTIKEEIYNKENIREQLIAQADTSLTDKLKENFKYSYMIESGARGSWDQVKQLIINKRIHFKF
jgi:DNA-directed RNA polymerase subunit beta'